MLSGDPKQSSPQVRRIARASGKRDTISPRLAIKRKLQPALGTPGVSTGDRLTGFSQGATDPASRKAELSRKLARRDTESSRRFVQRTSSTSSTLDQFNETASERIVADLPTADAASRSNTINFASIPCGGKSLDAGYKYMAIKADIIGDFLDSRIVEFSEIILDQMREQVDNNTDPNDIVLSHPGVPSQQEVLSVGRITYNPKEDSRISHQNVFLESSRRLGSGARVQLDLTKLTASQSSYSIFSGQIVGVRGTNPSGKLFIVKEFIFPDAPEPSSLVYSRKSEETVSDSATSVMIASGPYTFSDNINYEPLATLVNDVILASDSKINTCIFNGPFVDDANEYISTQCDATAEEIFKFKVAPYFNKLIDRGVQVILVASLRDMIIPFVALPQPPLVFGRTEEDQTSRRQSLRLKSGIKYVSNPGLFQINGATIALCNSDAILEIMGNELSANSRVDRFASPFNHFLQQRTFIPVFPPSTESISTPLVEPTMAQHLSLDVIPDVFISVSTMKPFIREVNNSLCINPGHAVKGKFSGSYSILNFDSLKGLIQNGESQDSTVKPLQKFTDACSCRIVNI